MTRRTLAILIIFFSILFLPYWVYIPVLFIGIVLFTFFWEGIILALLIDVIHGDGVLNLESIIFSFAFYSLVLLIILLPIRDRMRSHV